MNKKVKIQNHRNSNFITSVLISNENQPLGITAIWYENDGDRAKENTPKIGEICKIRIEGNYEIDTNQNLWLQFETWDSNQNGITNKNHIDTNRLIFGQIKRIERQENSFINCQFQVNKSLNLTDEQPKDHLEEK